MLIFTTCVLYICYGIKVIVKLWKQRNRRDVIVLSVLTAVITGYWIPVVGDAMPTAESLYTSIYKPISDYVVEVLNIKSEVH